MENMLKEFKDIISNAEEITCAIIIKQIDNNFEILNIVGDYHKLLGLLIEELLNREAKEKDFRYTTENMFNGIEIETTSGKDKEAVTNKYYILKYAKKPNTDTTYSISSSGDELKETLTAVKNMVCKNTTKAVNDTATVSTSNLGTIKTAGNSSYITEEITYTIIKQINNEMEILDLVGDYHKALGILMEELFNRGAKENDFRYTAPVNMLNDNGIVIEATSGKGKEAVMNKYFILKYAKKANADTTYSISCPGGEAVDPIIGGPITAEDRIVVIPCDCKD